MVVISNELLAEWISTRWSLWQCDFLTADQFAEFASKRGVSIPASYLEELWRLGWLRADYVISNRVETRKGLVRQTDWSGVGIFHADLRQAKPRKARAKTFGPKGRLRQGLKPFFHPFRYYLLARMRWHFQIHAPGFQSLFPEGLRRSVDDHISHSLKRFGSREFSARINGWNNLVNLAVALEPFGYPQIVGETVARVWEIDRSEWDKSRFQYWTEVEQCLKSVPLEILEESHVELCSYVEDLDSNTDVHRLLRLSRRQAPHKEINGRLGGAMLVGAMAEVLRRGCQRAFAVELPEEDDLAFGASPRRNAWKKRVLGGRLFDGDPMAATEYLRYQYLDYRPRLRWYVEGDVEVGALKYALGVYGAFFVEVKNLRGLIIEGKSKGLTFRGSLRDDVSTQVFSYVTIDGDRSDNTWILRKAATQGKKEFFGRFFIHTSDFELDNFSTEELQEILWQLAVENGAPENSNDSFHAAFRDLTVAIGREPTMNDLIVRAKEELPDYLAHVKKDENLGKALMIYALKNPKKVDSNEDRPVIGALVSALRKRDALYTRTYNEMRTNEHGELVPENKA